MRMVRVHAVRDEREHGCARSPRAGCQRRQNSPLTEMHYEK